MLGRRLLCAARKTEKARRGMPAAVEAFHASRLDTLVWLLYGSCVVRYTIVHACIASSGTWGRVWRGDAAHSRGDTCWPTRTGQDESRMAPTRPGRMCWSRWSRGNSASRGADGCRGCLELSPIRRIWIGVFLADSMTYYGRAAARLGRSRGQQQLVSFDPSEGGDEI